MVLKGDAQLMRKILCCSALLEDVATLFRVAQRKGLHGQCVLKVFSYTSERQVITVAHYLGSYEGRFEPQTRPWQCGAGCAK